MSEMGRGVPMDALDAVCRSYKECQKCARERYGDQCIGEFYAYDYSTNNGNSVCNDDADTCNRALCECDRKFAIGKSNHYIHSSLTGLFRPCCRY